VLERTETQIEGLPVLAPTIDIVSIGAGGGSIARLDETGALRVGPDSAGARPGPACFGLGGTEPTVTDAHVILGWLDPETFLGSRMHLDAGAAGRAIDDRIGGPLHLPTHLTADGIVRIAEFAMANAISSMTVERGADPRDFALYAYGGGGGLFAAPVADELEIPIVVIPREPAAFSAWGMLGADIRFDAAATIVARLDADAIDRAVKEVDALRDRLLTEFEGRGTPRTTVRIGSFAELRFEGQEHTVGVPFDPEGGAEFVESLRARFVERHRRLYGHGDPKAAIEIVAVRGRATVPTEPPRWPTWTVTGNGEAEVRRPVYFRGAGGWLDTAVYVRDHLAAGRVVDGPAIIREWSSTAILPPGWTARTDDLGNLLLERS
jgi:N-methylhydantoinase A